MNRRLFIHAVLALVLLSTTALPALADEGGSDNGDGKGGGHSQGSGEEHGQGAGHGGDGNPGAGNDGNGGNGNADHDQAKHALDAAEALPLSQVLTRFRQLGDFTVIDVKLSHRNQSLVYVFKYIDGSGMVRKAVFDARSGDLVR
jgi:hypothetical protein